MQQHATRLRQGNTKRESGFGAIFDRHLMWFEELGIGYFEVQGNPYDLAYFDKYAGYAKTEMGEKINRFRLEFVDRYYHGDALIDVGIGSGHFIEARNASGQQTYGYDINPVGEMWLQQRKLFRYPYTVGERFEALTCWDVLEHIRRPCDLLERIDKFVFVSVPIFTDAAHVLRSRHYRKDEHYWYFTSDGLVKMMQSVGFECLNERDDETKLGREDIKSFVFKRA